MVLINRIFSLSFICSISCLINLTSFAQPGIDSSFESTLLTDHNLVGKIWSSRSQSFIEIEEFLSYAESASYLLLGEKHDNPDHHTLQLYILNYFLEREKVSNVSLEMLESDDQVRLNALQENSNQNSISISLASLNEELDWDDEGWDWGFYGPLIQAALQGGAPLSAGNITTETMQQVYGDSNTLGGAFQFDNHIVDKLNQDIDESHCGLLPESQFPSMVRVQRARDVSLASSLHLPAAEKLSVLIAGNYHIRQDLGVPNYLMGQNSQLERQQIVAISFMEVSEDVNDPAEYLQQFSDVAAFDFIWFTPAVSNENYCASLLQ